MGCVYVATNRINGKKYVGRTIHTLQTRRDAHQESCATGYFQNALRKYGPDNFDWDVLFVSDDVDELNDEEKWNIRLLKTRAPNGYNMTDGGEGIIGYNHTNETKQSISSKMKGIPKTEETLKRMSEAFARRLQTLHGQAIQRALAERKIGKHRSEETKQKLRLANLGKKQSEERKKNTSIALKGRVFSEEHRKNLSKAAIGRKLSEEHKQSLKRGWAKRKGLPQTQAQIEAHIVIAQKNRERHARNRKLKELATCR